MRHGNPASQKRSFDQRILRAVCVDHEWENVGMMWLEPRRGIFGRKKVWWFTSCCGRPMAQMREVRMRRCKKCRHWEEIVTNDCIALCHRCSRRRIHPSADYDM